MTTIRDMTRVQSSSTANWPLLVAALIWAPRPVVCRMWPWMEK